MHHGAAISVPDTAVKARLARGVRQVLIQWRGEPPSAATWEDVEDSAIQHFSPRMSCSSRGERCHVGEVVHPQV